MGFYAPAQIVRDARAHGVEIRPPCVNASRWDCTLEQGRGRFLAVRLGLRMARGLSNLHGAMIVSARGEEPFKSVEAVWRRAGVPPVAIERLAEADAFHSLAHDRRQALWQVKGLGDAPLPLFAAADAREGAISPESQEPMVTLEPLSEGREVVEDYRTIQLSLRAHPVQFLREELRRRGVKAAADLDQVKDGRHVEVAGIILVRQKPGSAKGVLFITIEDETGIANGILWPDRFEAQRRTVLSSAMVGLRGRLQREGIVTHIIIDKIIDYTPMLRSIGSGSLPHLAAPADGATRGGGPDARDGPKATMVRIKSRDFH
jgi:error-prone DNA polymerase